MYPSRRKDGQLYAPPPLGVRRACAPRFRFSRADRRRMRVLRDLPRVDDAPGWASDGLTRHLATLNLADIFSRKLTLPSDPTCVAWRRYVPEIEHYIHGDATDRRSVARDAGTFGDGEDRRSHRRAAGEARPGFEC